MTVCGNKISGVCVMGKCPYVKICSPAEWDKGEPMTNEEYIHSLNTEQFAWLISVIVGNAIAKHDNGIDDDIKTEYWIDWLKRERK